MENILSCIKIFLCCIWKFFIIIFNAIQHVAPVVTSIILLVIGVIVFRRTQGSCFTTYFDHTSLIAEKFVSNGENRDQCLATPCGKITIHNEKDKSFVISKIFIAFDNEHKFLLKNYERKPLNIQPYGCKTETIQPISCFGKNGKKYIITDIDKFIKPKIILEDLSGTEIETKETYKPDTSQKESDSRFFHEKGYDPMYATSTLMFRSQYYQKNLRKKEIIYFSNDKGNYFIPVRYYGSSGVVYSADVGAVIDVLSGKHKYVFIFSKNNNLIEVGYNFYEDFKIKKEMVLDNFKIKIEEIINCYSKFKEKYTNLKQESSKRDKELADKIRLEATAFGEEVRSLIAEISFFKTPVEKTNLNIEIYDVSNPDIFDDVNPIEITQKNRIKSFLVKSKAKSPCWISGLLRTLRVRLSR